MLLLAAALAPAQTLEIPREAQASPTFDAVKATDAYLATVPADKRARSDAYFEGGYWIQLWSFLYGAAVLWLLLATGVSAWMRDRAERITRWRAVHTVVYFVQFLLVTTIATFPLSVYTDFVREHQYDLATQTFWPWFGDQLKALGVGLVFGGLAMMVLYAVLRRVGRSWWLWATFVVVFFNIIGAVIAPVFIAPLFNTYTRLTDPAIREPVLSMAHANGITADDVYVVDQSRQTTRISANVSGLLGTERISLNDNLLKRGTLEGNRIGAGARDGTLRPEPRVQEPSRNRDCRRPRLRGGSLCIRAACVYASRSGGSARWATSPVSLSSRCCLPSIRSRSRPSSTRSSGSMNTRPTFSG